LLDSLLQEIKYKIMKVKLGAQEYRFPSKELGELEDHTDLYLRGDWEKLRTEIQRLGYLRVKQLHDREQVFRARTAVLEYIKSSGEEKLDSSEPLESGILDSRCGIGCLPFMEGKNYISHHQVVLEVLEGSRPRQFFEKLLGGEILTFDYKWLRGVPRTAFTGAHVDNVYMSRGTSQLYTMWTPLGDVTTDMGTLALVESSNNKTNFQRFQVGARLVRQIHKK